MIARDKTFEPTGAEGTRIMVDVLGQLLGATMMGSKRKREARRRKYAPGTVVTLPAEWQARADKLGLQVTRGSGAYRFILGNGSSSSHLSGMFDAIVDAEREAEREAQS